MRYPVVDHRALGGWIGTPAPTPEPISTHPLLGKWQPNGWKFWQRKKKPQAPAAAAAPAPAPTGGTGTTPTGGTGTTPTGGAGTTPTGGTGTTPTGGTGTTPTGGTGTTPTGGAGTTPDFGPGDIGPMFGPIPTQPIMAPQAPGASPWPGYGSPIGAAPPGYGGGIPAQPMPAPALMPPSRPMACENALTPKSIEDWVEACPGVREARGY